MDGTWDRSHVKITGSACHLEEEDIAQSNGTRRFVHLGNM